MSTTDKIESLEAMYQKVVTEVLLCDPIPASKRAENQLEPPREVIARIRAERADLSTRVRALEQALMEAMEAHRITLHACPRPLKDGSWDREWKNTTGAKAYEAVKKSMATIEALSPGRLAG